MSYVRLFVGCGIVCVLAVAGTAQAAPLAWYNMEEASGSTLYDQVGTETAVENGQGGFLYQQAGVPAGTYGNIVLPYSTGHAVGIQSGYVDSGWRFAAEGYLDEMNLVNNFTVMSWIYVPEFPPMGSQRPIVISAELWTSKGYTLGVSWDYAEGVYFSKHAIRAYGSGTDISTGAWHHIAATQSSTAGVTLYLDGVMVRTVLEEKSTRDINILTVPGDRSFILGNGDSDSDHLDGCLVDDFRVYNTVLTGAEIIEEAKAGMIPEPSTLALLATGLIGLLCYAWRKRK